MKPVGDCNKLEENFTKRFHKNYNNVDELEKIERFLSVKGCTNSELFKKVIARIDSLKPKALISDPIQFRFLTKEEQLKKIKSLHHEIEKTDNDTIKGRLLYSIARLYKELGKKEEAKNYALKATQYNANFGAPYVLLAVMYTQESSSYDKESIDRYAVYWAAVDKLKKAKEVDPSINEAVNKLIKRYETYFPYKEKAISFPKWKPGDTYHIGGWINETTTARFMK